MFDKREYQRVFSKVTASDETYRRVMDMKNEGRTSNRGRTMGRIILIAAIISLLVVTVSAAESVASWFRGYFADRSQEALTDQQVQYIEDSEQQLELAQTQDGYTIRMKSVICDGRMAYITLGITGPEDAVLNKTVIEGYSPDKPSIFFGNYDYLTPVGVQQIWGSMSISSLEDHDGLDNTQDLLITLEPTFEEGTENFMCPGSVWNLHIENLIAQYVDEAYIESLEEKYTGENVLIPDEEGEFMFPQVILAEGVWDFQFTLGEFDDRAVELITDPVAITAAVGWKADGTDVYEKVNVTSVSLRALGMSILADHPGADFSNNYDQLIYVVMKDGTKIQMICSGGSAYGSEYLAEAPIILEDADFVLFADGTKLMVPDLSE